MRAHALLSGVEMITAFKQINELIRLDPATGQLFSREPRSGVPFGRPLGTKKPSLTNGYHWVKISGVDYPVHRIVWLLTYGEWPKQEIDHINRDKTDNRPENLRDVSRSENMINREVRFDSASRVKGVERTRSGWRARFCRRSLGTFKTKEEAIFARNQAEADHKEMNQ